MRVCGKTTEKPTAIIMKNVIMGMRAARAALGLIFLAKRYNKYIKSNMCLPYVYLGVNL